MPNTKGKAKATKKPEGENARNSINQGESIDFIHEALEAEGIKITKADIDRVLDKARDLSINALVQGQAIKIRGLGTLEIREHKARPYKTPVLDADGKHTGEWKEGTTPAGKHVEFVESDSLLDAMNKKVNPENPLMQD